MSESVQSKSPALHWQMSESFPVAAFPARAGGLLDAALSLTIASLLMFRTPKVPPERAS